MQIPSPNQNDQTSHSRPERPRNRLVSAIVFLIILSPLCLLIGASSLYTAWALLTGPAFRSETPAWLGALMQLLRVVVAVLGFFIPIAALGYALKVNAAFDRGDYVGSEKAARSAASYCKQSLIFLVLIIMIMAIDLLTFVAS